MDIKTIGVEEWLNVWEKSATWDIAQSTISSLTMGELRALDEQDGATFYERLDREKMNYGWIEGSPEFKAEVAKLYRREVNPDHILQTNGCTGANLNAIMAVVEPGDHVIAEWPTYAPLYEIPRTLGAEVEYWELREELGWKPDIEELKRLVCSNTKLICINNASNPIGTVLDADTLGQIAEIARSVGAYVLCDEVYLPLENTEDFLSMADVYEKAIVTNSVSKTYSTPAARVGWVVTDEEVSNRIRTYRDYTMICGGVFNDALATYALKHKDRISSAIARSCLETAISHRLGSTRSTVSPGRPRRVCPPRLSNWTFPRMTRSSASACCPRGECCWCLAAALSFPVAHAWATARARTFCARA